MEPIKTSRKQELRLRAQTLDDLIKLLKTTSDDIELSLSQYTDDAGNLRRQQLEAMLQRVNQDIDTFTQAYEELTMNSTRANAQLIIERDGNLFLELEGQTVYLGDITDKVVIGVATMKYSDGLTLSDRIWRIGTETKAQIASRISKGILEGESHIKVARDIRKNLTTGATKYQTERLVLTQMAQAYKMANQAAVEVMNQQGEMIWHEKWELSPRHPSPDVCDVLATQDLYGEGPGVYKKAPARHPNCYCYIYPVARKKGEKVTYEDISPETPNPNKVKNGAKQANGLMKIRTKLDKSLDI